MKAAFALLFCLSQPTSLRTMPTLIQCQNHINFLNAWRSCVANQRQLSASASEIDFLDRLDMSLAAELEVAVACRACHLNVEPEAYTKALRRLVWLIGPQRVQEGDILPKIIFTSGN